MTKVLEVVPTLGVGGAETLVRDYCILTDKQKVQIKVIVLDKRHHTTIEKDMQKMGVDIAYLGNMLYGDKKVKGIFHKVIRYLSRYYFFNKAVNQFNPDVIHIHLHLGLYFRFLFLKNKRVKFILTVHNVTDRYFSKRITDVKKYCEYKEVSRLIKQRQMLLIALHKKMETELRDYFDTDRVVIVRNGIRLDKFRPELYDSNAVRKGLGIEEGSFVIGNIGRFHEQKNHKLIIEVFSSILVSNPDSVLILVGSGELEKEVRKSIEERNIQKRVILLSNRSDIPQILSAIDVFFLPSLWEGFPVTLIEAQAMRHIRCNR